MFLSNVSKGQWVAGTIRGFPPQGISLPKKLALGLDEFFSRVSFVLKGSHNHLNHLEDRNCFPMARASITMAKRFSRRTVHLLCLEF